MTFQSSIRGSLFCWSMHWLQLQSAALRDEAEISCSECTNLVVYIRLQAFLIQRSNIRHLFAELINSCFSSLLWMRGFQNLLSNKCENFFVSIFRRKVSPASLYVEWWKTFRLSIPFSCMIYEHHRRAYYLNEWMHRHQESMMYEMNFSNAIKFNFFSLGGSWVLAESFSAFCGEVSKLFRTLRWITNVSC